MRRFHPLYWRCLPLLISGLFFGAFAATATAATLDGGVLSGAVDDDAADDAEDVPPTSAEPVDGGGMPSVTVAPRVNAGPSGSAAIALARFDAALHLITVGKERAAAEALLKLAEELPKDDIAPEALFEAGLLYEEQLASPEPAARCYRALVTKYPQSRLLRRAQQRLTQLEAALRTGAGPLVSFQAILRTTAAESSERRSRLQQLLVAHPDFALADQGLFLLADSALRSGDNNSAEAHFAELYARFPKSSWAAQGHRLHAETLLGRRHIDAARAHYRALLQFDGPLWPVLTQEGLLACRRAERLLYIALFGWAYLLMGGVFLLWRARRRLWPPPFELWYYLPIAGLLSLAAQLVHGGSLAAPIWQLGLGGAALAWLAAPPEAAPEVAPAAAEDGTSSLERYGWPRLLLGLTGRALAAAILFFLVIYHNGLLEVMVETLRNGPDA